MKLLAMTVSCMDLYQDNYYECLGGNSLNFATQANKSENTKVSFLGAVGTDRYGRLIQDHFIKAEIDVSHLYQIEGRTATSKVYLDEDGERYFKPNSWDGGVLQSFRLSEADWDFVWKHDIIAMPCWDPNLPAMLEHKKHSNKLVVDFVNVHDLDFFRQTLPFCDIAFISGNQAVVETFKPFAIELEKMIVITLGAEGSVTIDQDKTYYQPTETVKKAIDTNGCGDAYQAAFTVSFFENGNIMKAMKTASLAAAQVLTHIGGVE